jgi:hypothetical protein
LIFGAASHVGLQSEGHRPDVLEEGADERHIVIDVEFLDIDAVEQDLAACRLVESAKKLDQSGFAGAVIANEAIFSPG